MKYKTKTINISTLEKENGETFLIFPKSKVRLVVDATKADYDDWFVKMFYEKFFDKMNNIYNFEFDTILGSSNITEDELDDIYANDFAKYIELGKEVFDEHFEEMYEMEEEHRLDIFQHYIKECMGWKIKDVTDDFDYEFRW